MSLLMRDWIRPAVEKELSEAAHHFSKKPLTNGQNRKRHRTLDEHGLTIELQKVLFVQVLVINEAASTCHAWLSDGTTLIAASFNGAATIAFERSHGRPFSKERRGTVISIKKCNLPTCSEHLSLEILDFELEGSEGSQTFGKPKDIMKHSGIQAALSKVEQLFTSPGSPVPVASQPSSPLRPQTQVRYATQTAFASQLPSLPQKSKDAAIQEEDPKRRQSNTPNLLSPLKKNTVSVLQDNSVALQIPSVATATNPRKPAILSEASQEKALGMTSKLEAKVNSQPTQSSPSSQSIYASNGSKSPLLPLPGQIDGEIHVSEKENSQESTKKDSHDAINADVEIVPTVDPKPQSRTASQKAGALPAFDPFLNGDMFSGLKRVPRKYVRMPKAQQNLLERSDAWFDPSADTKHIYALIPSKSHEELTVVMNQRQDPKFGPQNEQSDSGSDDSETSSGTDDEDLEGCVEGTGDKLTYDDNQEASDDGVNENASPTSDHFRDEISDEEHVPWSPSPERNLSKNTDLNIGLSIPSSPIQRDTEVKENAFDEAVGSVNEAVSHSPFPSPYSKNHRDSSPRLKRSMPVMLSSSPSPEEELEMDELHAVGDEVAPEDPLERDEFPARRHEDNVKNLATQQRPGISEEVPSTDLQNQRLVQVERTPDVKLHESLRMAPALSQTVPAREVTRGEPHSSLPEEIIPATCDDIASQRTMPSSSELNSDLPLSTIHKCNPSQLSNPEYMHSANIDNSLHKDEDTLAQQKVAAEFQNPQTQCRRSTPLPNKSPSQHRSPPPATRPEAQKQATGGIPPANVASPSVKRHVDATRSKKRHLPLKRRSYSQAVAAIQLEESTTKSITEMARAVRHSNSFTERLSGGVTKRAEFPSKATEPNMGASASTNGSPESPRNTPQMVLLPSPAAVVTTSMTRDPHVSSSARQALDSAKLGINNSNQTGTMDDPVHNSPGEIEPVQTLLETQKVPNYYENFKAAYPDYTGNRGDFTWSLVYIEWLSARGKLVPKTLHDDFIVVNSLEYLVYVRQQRPQGENTMTGYEFYNEVAEQGRFRKGLIHLHNLRDALSSLDQERVERYRSKFNRPDPTEMPTSLNKKTVAFQDPQEPSDAQEPHVEPPAVEIMDSLDYQVPLAAQPSGSSMEMVESPAQQNVASPELGSSKTRQTVFRKPFFQTFSQMPLNSRDTSRFESSNRETLNTPTKSSIRGRTLPWVQSNSAPAPSSSPIPFKGIKRKRQATPPSPTDHHKSIKSSAQARPRSARDGDSLPPSNRQQSPAPSSPPQATSAIEFHGTPFSPILGSTPKPTSSSTTRRKLAKSTSTPDQTPAPAPAPAPQPSSPFHPPSLTALRDTTSATSKSIDGENKVSEWLSTQPILTPSQQPKLTPRPQQQQPKRGSRFEAFLAERRRSEGVLSRKSTPRSTPGNMGTVTVKGICTRPRKGC